MKICFYYRVEQGKKQFHITVENQDFDKDKEIALNDIPMEQWFNKAEEGDIEWEGLIFELEKFTNANYKEFMIDVIGDDDEKSRLYSFLNKMGYSFMCIAEKEAEKSKFDDKDIQKQLENANRLYNEKKYDDALRIYNCIKNDRIEALFMMAEIYYLDLSSEEHDDSQALKMYLKCANSGYIPAYAKVARYYYYRNDEDEVKSEAYEWAKKGHENNDTLGTLYLARCNYYGVGCSENKEEAERLYQICVESEERPTSYYELGIVYYNDKHYDDAFKMFCRGSEKENCSNCKLCMAACYEEGLGTEIDKYKAVTILKSISNENFEAKRQLARYYVEGIGVEVDEKKAFEMVEELYEEKPDELNTILYASIIAENEDFDKAEEVLKYAIESKFSGAKELMGQILLSNKKYREALAILKSAIKDKKENEANILRTIGDCYSSEDCEFYDMKEPVKYYRRAADLGNESAMLIMGAKYSEDGNDVKAQEYFDKAVEKGNSFAEFVLAEKEYEKGNYKKAEKVFKKYAKQGDMEAQYKLGLTYIKLKSIDDGVVWLKQAAGNGKDDAYLILAMIYSTDDYKRKDNSLEYEYLVKGSESGNIECTRRLAIKYLYDKDYSDEKKGIDLLKEQINKRDLSSKYELSMFYYTKYSRAICHNTIFKSVKYKKVTKKKRNELNDEDIKSIKDLVSYFKDMKDDKRFNEKTRKMIKKLLDGISDKFKD